MIILDNLGKFRKGRLWINILPEMGTKTVDIIEVDCNKLVGVQWPSKAIALELLLAPREISNYGLLGLKYIPSKNNSLKIKININNFDGDVLNDNIALSTDEVHMGVPKQYALAIRDASLEIFKNMDFPPGTLLFDTGAHGYVGSSIEVFSKLTKILIKLIAKSICELSDDELKELVVIELKNL